MIRLSQSKLFEARVRKTKISREEKRSGNETRLDVMAHFESAIRYSRELGLTDRTLVGGLHVAWKARSIARGRHCGEEDKNEALAR